MTKKEELLRMYCDRMTDIERYVFYGKDGVLKAMEKYGKYCAEQAYTHMMFSSMMKPFEDWWNEFKNENK